MKNKGKSEMEYPVVDLIGSGIGLCLALLLFSFCSFIFWTNLEKIAFPKIAHDSTITEKVESCAMASEYGVNGDFTGSFKIPKNNPLFDISNTGTLKSLEIVLPDGDSWLHGLQYSYFLMV